MAVAPLVGMVAASISEFAAAATQLGQVGDGVPDFVYDAATGDLTFSFDGLVPTLPNGAPSYVCGLTLFSATRQFQIANLTSAFNANLQTAPTSTSLYGSLVDGTGFTSGFDLGRILPTDLSPTALSQELTLNYQLYLNGLPRPSDFVFAGAPGTNNLPTTIFVSPVSPVPGGPTGPFFYTGPSGNWSDASKWYSGIAPGTAGGQVFIQPFSGITVVNLDSAANSSLLTTLAINGTGSATAVLTQTQGNIHTSLSETIGVNGNGFVVQSGGVHGSAGSLILASQSGSTGSYSLVNGSLAVNALTVGQSGTGNFAQSGGDVAVKTALLLGSDASGSGLYSLSGTATLTTATETIAAYLIAGNPPSTFNQSGGVHTITSALTIGKVGTFNLSGGSLFVSGSEVIGNVFNQTGGTHTITPSSTGGQWSTSGTYNLGGGSLVINGTETVGTAFNQSGGTHTITSGALTALSIAGPYNLSGGSLHVVGGEVITAYNTPFTQSGGNHVVDGVLQDKGIYKMSGGSLEAGNLAISATDSFTLSGAGTRLIDAPIDNYGTFTVNATTAVFTGTFNNRSLYASKGADNYFQSLVNIQGQITAGPGDRFFINGDFNSVGESRTGLYGFLNLLKVAGAEFHFSGQGNHIYSTTPSSDAGVFPAMIVDPGDTLNILTGSVAVDIANQGSLIVTSGSATLSNLTGTGSFTLGNASGSQRGLLLANTVNQSSVFINANSTLRLNQGTATTISTMASLVLGALSKLDLNNNSVVVNYGTNASPIASIQAWVNTGRNGGTWTGPGIDSTFVSRDPVHYAIGYADGADHVVTGLSSTQALVRTTLIGDVNLDGGVTQADITQINSRGHYNDGTPGNGWIDGDFNGDGLVNAADLQLLNASGNLKGTIVLSPVSGVGLVSVPEPASIGLLGLAAIGLTARRRKR